MLAKYHMLHNHHIDLDSDEIVDRSSAGRQRLILEAWHPMPDRKAINEHIALPIFTIPLRISRVLKNTRETIVTLLRGVI